VKNINEQIETLLHENADSFQISKVLKTEINTYFDTLEETFSTSGGKDFLVKHTNKIDALLKFIYKIAKREMFEDYAPMKNSIPLALVALGSYGREQLCVYSDIDLMIVYKEIPGYNIKEMVEKILYLLWDTGLKIGHRVHVVEELFPVSKTDITIKTAILESRFIEGSHFIWTQVQNEIENIRHDGIKDFIVLKMQEQKLKHQKFPLTMEPNLKDGVGGFRDANIVYWIGKILYNTDNIKSLPSTVVKEEEYRVFRIALEFLFRVRSALHLASNKKEDQLRLDLIPKVSELLGYEQDHEGHIKFAKKVTESLKIIRLYSIIWLDILTREYTTLQSHKIYIDPAQEDLSFPILLKKLCQKASVSFTPHASFLKALISSYKTEEETQQTEKATIFSIFYQPHCYSILNTLSCAGLLKEIIPPIKKVVNLPQFDGYHQYAVDIHSLRCVYYLEHIEDVFIASLFETLDKDEKAMLKMVTFLHDSGKGRKKDHHLVGVRLFKTFAKALQMQSELISLGEILIRYHTLMSNIAQREDLYSEKIILSFASHFQSQKLLDMIYILTYADMNGVGGDIYNSFSAKLIKILYKNAKEVLGSKKVLDEASKRSKKELLLKKHPDFLALKRSQQKKILQMPSNLLFLRYKPARIIAICKKAFETKTYTYHISNEEYLTIELIRKETLFNLPYLLSKLDMLEVVNMDISKLFDELKYFKITFSSHIEEDEIFYIKRIIEDSFKQKEKKPSFLPTIKMSEIEIDCDHTKTYAIMHIRSKNQKGLLIYVINMLNEMQIEIVTAKVHTLKNRVRDMFLIEKDGNFCHNVDEIKERLTRIN